MSAPAAPRAAVCDVPRVPRVGGDGASGAVNLPAPGAAVSGAPPPRAVRVPDPFSAFVARHRRALYGLAHRLSGSHAAADDLVQETLVQAWHAFDTLRDADAAGAWLRRILVRRYLNTHRTPWHRRVVRGLLGPGDDGHPALDVPDGAPAAPPDPTFEAALARGLAALSERERAAFVLRHLDDRSTADTAAAMQVSEGTVKTLLSRAVAKMHVHLRPYA